MKKYTVIRAGNEQKNYWEFSPSNFCEKTVEAPIKTGDYTIAGLENKFTIERKHTTAEFAQNINEERFERELDRMDKLEHAFIICEFTMEDVNSFPFNSGIPSKLWNKLRVTSNYIKKRMIEIETAHKVKIILAGNNGADYAERIFKRMQQLYGKE